MFATVARTVGTLASTVVFAIDGKTDGTGGRIAAIGAKTAATNGTEHGADRRGLSGRGSRADYHEDQRDADQHRSHGINGTRIGADQNGINGTRIARIGGPMFGLVQMSSDSRHRGSGASAYTL
jgi:hypothetical protein